ncbi:MAG: cation-transporting P-type ATPase, partial [Deltaproteobacteria bacterium]|nr:cation-transporting P-type ATPase [Deltaproteobacteria bacterium]
MISYKKSPWALDINELLKILEVSPEKGLSHREAGSRLEKYGKNRLRSKSKKSAISIFIDQWKSLIILLLAAAAVVSLVFGQHLESVAIIVAIILNVLIGFFTELRATRSMEALHRISSINTNVIRDGESREEPSENIVPGDILEIEAGNVIPADLRIIESSRLNVDESALTGESVPVSKNADTVPEDNDISERGNMLFKGTSVTKGSAKAVAAYTGMDTELGRIAHLTEEAEEDISPLEKRLERLGHRLIWITLGIGVLITVLGIMNNRDIFVITKTAIALAVAAIPEGLPIVATIALARGMWRMAKKNAVINRLSAVETLGATTVICTDKTGTLTENKMIVGMIALPQSGGEGVEEVDLTPGNSKEKITSSEEINFKKLLETTVLSSKAELKNISEEGWPEGSGEPMEIALLALGRKNGVEREPLLEKLPEQREETFDSRKKMMATFHKEKGSYRVAVKGAPEAVLNVCSRIGTGEENDRDLTENDIEKWTAQNERMASGGLRILAVATKSTDDLDSNPYEELTFLGFTGFMDPPRKNVAEVISACRNAGIRVVMITGDHSATAKSIGLSVKLIDTEDAEVAPGKRLLDPADLSDDEKQKLIKTSIFARVSPEQKYNLVKLHKEQREVVAMTGDGINDAPALKKADIGIAMGRRSTQVAKEAADMVLKDDSFRTIVTAVSQGRAIFDNIRKFIIFLLSGNAGEIMIVAFPILINSSLPLLPLQILYLNLIGDVLLALALGVGRDDPSKMLRPPRHKNEAILTRSHWLEIIGYALIIAIPVLSGFYLALGRMDMSLDRAVTVSFLSLAFSRIWHVFNMRDSNSGLFKNDITRNPFVWGALALCI